MKGRKSGVRRVAAFAAAAMVATSLMSACSKQKELDLSVRSSDLYVEKNEAVGDNFVMGVDISSYIAELQSGVVYYDFEGNALDEDGFYDLLYECGVTHVRIRVWNDPYDSEGRSYGGGNNDVDTACRIAKSASEAGLKLIIDFHYSDFWADPSKQMVPKAWEGMTLDEKGDALYDFTLQSLEAINKAGGDIDIVQIGNETTNGFCGESKWENMAKLFSQGSKAVRDFDEDVRVAMHFANPERENAYSYYADQLDLYGVNYDIFASSYYPYWHGTLENLTEVLGCVADTYGKQVMVVESSWVYRLDDGDGSANTISDETVGVDMPYVANEQGQADMISDVISAVTDVGDLGIGFCYWEPAWIPVQVAYDEDGTLINSVKEENRVIWNRCGSGWASVFAGEYDPDDAGQYYGGSAVDNQALFDYEGHPLESLRTFLYVRTGTDAPEPTATPTPMPDPGFVASEGDVITNGSFESGLDGWDVDGFNTEDAASNSRTGSGSMHFYSATAGATMTATQTVQLEAGTYDFSAWLEGGDAGTSDVFKVTVEVDGQIYEGTGNVTGWQQWSEITISPIEVTGDTQAIVTVSVSGTTAGVWGAFDDITMVKR